MPLRSQPAQCNAHTQTGCVGLFCSLVQLERTHFHDFMIEVHQRLRCGLPGLLERIFSQAFPQPKLQLGRPWGLAAARLCAALPV